MRGFPQPQVRGHGYGDHGPEPEDGDFARAFGERFEREYGFKLVGRDLLIDDVRVRGIGKSTLLQRVKIPNLSEGKFPGNLPDPDSVARVYFEGGWREAPVFLLEQLGAGALLEGPCVVMNGTATCIIEPGCVAEVTEYGDLKIAVDVVKDEKSKDDEKSTEVVLDSSKKDQKTRPRSPTPCSCPSSTTGSWASPSRWVARCSAPASAPTSRSVWTFPARCSARTGAWWRTRLTSRCI